MEKSIYLAQLFGVVYLCVGLGALINPKYYKRILDDFLKSEALLYLGGAAALVIGFVLVNLHNLWVKDWPVIITVIAWLSVIKGALLLIQPDPLLKITKQIAKKKKFTAYGLAALALGAILAYFGFFA